MCDIYKKNKRKPKNKTPPETLSGIIYCGKSDYVLGVLFRTCLFIQWFEVLDICTSATHTNRKSLVLL